MPKISDLTADSSPVAGALIPAVEGGGTVIYTLAAMLALGGVILETRDPTTADTAHANGVRWINTTTGAIFECLDKASGLWGASGASESLASHLADTSNPHSVTKSQVGLGSVANVLHKLDASAAPTVNDDAGDGYSAGSMWVDTTNGKAYFCTDASSGAAVWFDPSASGNTVSVVTVSNPGATWTPTLADNTIYLVTLDQACAITLGSGVTGSNVHMSSIYLDRQGYAATISNADDTDPSVTLNAASGTVEMLAVEHRIVGGSKHYHVWQFGTEGGTAGSALPSSGLVTEYLFTSDATDNVGSNDLTLRNGATVVTTGDKGLTLDGTDDYADVVSLVVNTDLDFTVYVAFNHANSTSGSDEQIIGWGRTAAGGSYLDLYYDDGISKFRVITKDTDGVNGSGGNINYGDCPSGWQLWKVMRSGDALTVQCLTNGASAIGTFPPGSMDLDALAFGCRYVNTNPSRYCDGVIGWAAFYSRAITSSSEDAQVVDYVSSTRGLSDVEP